MSSVEKLKIIGCLCATSGMIVMYFIFMAAYMSPNKSTCIDIDNYGEATIEVIMIHLQMILSIIGTSLIILLRHRPPKNENKNITRRNLGSV